MVVETNFLFLNFLFFYLFIEVWFTYHKVHISSVYIAHWILRLNIPAPRPIRALPVSQSPSCPLSVINLSSFSPEYTLALLVKAQISLYLFLYLIYVESYNLCTLWSLASFTKYHIFRCSNSLFFLLTVWYFTVWIYNLSTLQSMSVWVIVGRLL